MREYNITLFQDSLIPGAEIEITTRGAGRILFVLDGSVIINNQEYTAGKTAHIFGIAHIITGFKPATLLRYEFLENADDAPEIISNGATMTKLDKWQWFADSDVNQCQLDILTLLNHNFTDNDTNRLRHYFIYEGAGYCQNDNNTQTPYKSPYFCHCQTEIISIHPMENRQNWIFILAIGQKPTDKPIIDDTIARMNLLTCIWE